jgi:two-component system NtrC family sensor kinase
MADRHESAPAPGAPVGPAEASAPTPAVKGGWANELLGSNGRLIHTARLAVLGEITAGVAHEMNQPLAAIQVMVTSMLSDIDNGRLKTERARQWLDTINEQIGRISWIIGHVRSFSRNEPPDALAATSVGETVHDTLALLSAQLQSRGISVELDVAPGLPPVQGDSRYLEQVLLNLLSNARDALATLPDEAAKRLRIRAFEAPRGDGHPDADGQGVGRQCVDCQRIVLEVADNGPGMLPDVRERVFEPFFTTKQSNQGTGIGLSIVRTIVANCGGTISVESQPGEGATFRVVLPAARPGPGTGKEQMP